MVAAPAAKVRAIVGGGPPSELVVAVAPTPPTPNPPSEPVLGVCLSGGGSRALSAALGALSGLRSLPHPDDPTRSMMDEVKHLSSVSGGSWAAVAYTFLPAEVDGRPIDDDTFLIKPIPPDQLVKGGAAQAADVEHMDPRCLGTAPQQFAPLPIAHVLYKYWRWGMFKDRAKLSWFWIAAVGELILRPFDLYDAKYPRNSKVTEPTKYFSRSEKYFKTAIEHRNEGLDAGEFHFVRDGRPALVVNFNLLTDEARANSNQVPVQATPEVTGILGDASGPNFGGGSVQSLGFGTELLGRASESNTARVHEYRRYSLSDIAGCSSAFFAQGILSHIDQELDTIEAAIATDLRRRHIPGFIARWLAGFIRKKIEPMLNQDAAALIPRYPYWPLGQLDSPTPTTKPQGFSDGGTFEDTGVLGMLARTDANRIIAFINGAAPLVQDAATHEVKVDEQLGDASQPLARIEGQISTLFGYVWDDHKGHYRKYTDNEDGRFAQVFSDEGGAFEAVRNGLWNASTGGGADAGMHTAAFVQHLTTIDNEVAMISSGREITLLWVVNNRVNAWQDQITDAGIKADLAAGQAGQTPSGAPKIPKAEGSGPLKNFPLFTTAGQINLGKEAVNMLAQLTAWNVQQLQSDIEALLRP